MMCASGLARTAENMRPVLAAEIQLDPVAKDGDVSSQLREFHRGAHQSKSKGMASGPNWALKTFLNSSYEMKPELSLDGGGQFR